MPKSKPDTPAVQAKRAVNRIIADLFDRRGLKWEWQKIELSVQREIKKEWAALILEEITEARQSAARECAAIADDICATEAELIAEHIRLRFDLEGK